MYATALHVCKIILRVLDSLNRIAYSKLINKTSVYGDIVRKMNDFAKAKKKKTEKERNVDLTRHALLSLNSAFVQNTEKIFIRL